MHPATPRHYIATWPTIHIPRADMLTAARCCLNAGTLIAQAARPEDRIPAYRTLCEVRQCELRDPISASLTSEQLDMFDAHADKMDHINRRPEGGKVGGVSDLVAHFNVVFEDHELARRMQDAHDDWARATTFEHIRRHKARFLNLIEDLPDTVL